MSTFADIIQMVDGYKPNAFEDQLKVWWLVTLDGKIATEILLIDIKDVQEMMDVEWEEALEREPLVGFPYEELYLHYLEAKIDYANGEYTDYQNSMESFNAALENFKNVFLNRYDPAQGYPLEGRRTHE